MAASHNEKYSTTTVSTSSSNVGSSFRADKNISSCVSDGFMRNMEINGAMALPNASNNHVLQNHSIDRSNLSLQTNGVQLNDPHINNGHDLISEVNNNMDENSNDHEYIRYSNYHNNYRPENLNAAQISFPSTSTTSIRNVVHRGHSADLNCSTQEHVNGNCNVLSQSAYRKLEGSSEAQSQPPHTRLDEKLDASLQPPHTRSDGNFDASQPPHTRLQENFEASSQPTHTRLQENFDASQLSHTRLQENFDASQPSHTRLQENFDAPSQPTHTRLEGNFNASSQPSQTRSVRPRTTGRRMSHIPHSNTSPRQSPQPHYVGHIPQLPSLRNKHHKRNASDSGMVSR